MVSSAIYRYVDSRDDLLTRLIVESYNSLGDATEAAVAASAGRPGATRWVDAASTIRAWALARPHEYMLLYGTPVPGYAAPDDTVELITVGVGEGVGVGVVVCACAVDMTATRTTAIATSRASAPPVPIFRARESRHEQRMQSIPKRQKRGPEKCTNPDQPERFALSSCAGSIG
jgi:hypothetical protein